MQPLFAQWLFYCLKNGLAYPLRPENAASRREARKMGMAMIKARLEFA
jgi:hypothetical protein